MRYEIGSHFELDNNIMITDQKEVTWLPTGYDTSFTFSGRSAIELAIKDLMLERELKKVYMPSYCCKSMVNPFINNNIEIIFYDVFFEEGKGICYNINCNVECDIFFAISYFGLEKFMLDPYIKAFSEKGTVILEDNTQRLLNTDSHSLKVDYTIASLRKWFPIASGGYIVKHKDKLNIYPNQKSDSLVHEKFLAMKQKTEYLNGENDDKITFLNKMSKFEQEFKKRNYQYKIDSLSLCILQNIDINIVRKKRIDNARVLYDGIKELEHIKLLIPNPFTDIATPLFFPIMMEKSKRDHLRTFLIQHNVYCPVHWPTEGEGYSQISNDELSLVCDQRYSKNDMIFIVDLIQEWNNNLW